MEIREVAIYGSNEFSKLKPLQLNDEDLQKIPWDKYYTDKFDKAQIVLHHTVSGEGIRGDLATWKAKTSKIGTCIIIGRDGTIYQLFSSAYWAYHLGCGNANLDQHSIAVELDNWGQLTEVNGKLKTVYGNTVDVETVHYPLGYRGEQLFEAYSIPQLKALGELLLLWNKTYNIPLDYNEYMFDVNAEALKGEPGVWSHTSFRPWPSKYNKWDVHPDPNLKAMLRTVASISKTI